MQTPKARLDDIDKSFFIVRCLTAETNGFCVSRREIADKHFRIYSND